MTNGNDPAYAHTATEIRDSALQAARQPQEIHYSGLTKREYFAALAMQGCIHWDAIVNKYHETAKPAQLAVCAVAMADALIKELSK